LSATATGGSPPVQFKFWLRDGSGAWSILSRLDCRLDARSGRELRRPGMGS
jgi:hypothetical protein